MPHRVYIKYIYTRKLNIQHVKRNTFCAKIILTITEAMQHGFRNKEIHRMKYVILHCYDKCKIYDISQTVIYLQRRTLFLNYVHSYLKMVVLTATCSMHC